jgi:hypothetical protein
MAGMEPAVWRDAPTQRLQEQRFRNAKYPSQRDETMAGSSATDVGDAVWILPILMSQSREFEHVI